MGQIYGIDSERSGMVKVDLLRSFPGAEILTIVDHHYIGAT